MIANDAIDLLAGFACTYNGDIYIWENGASRFYSSYYTQKIEKTGSSFGGALDSWASFRDDEQGGWFVQEISTTGGDWPWLVQWPSAVVKNRGLSSIINIETATYSMFSCPSVFNGSGSPSFPKTLTISRNISASKTIIKNGSGFLIFNAISENPIVVNSGNFRINYWTGTSANINGTAFLRFSSLNSSSGVINVNDSAYLQIQSANSGIVVNLAENARFESLSNPIIGGITGNGLVTTNGSSFTLNLTQNFVFNGRINNTAIILTNTNSSNTNNSPRTFTLTNTLSSASSALTWGIGGDTGNASNRGNVVLLLGASNVIPDFVSLSIRGSSAATGNGSYQNTFDLNGFNETIGGLSNGAITSTGTKPGIVINNGSVDSVLTILAQSGTQNFSGQIRDGSTNKISLVKSGGSTQILSGSNAYSGGTTINVGILQIANANGLGTSGVVTFGGGTLQFATGITTDLSSRIKNSTSTMVIDTGSNAVTFASSIDSSNFASLQKLGSGTLTLSGSNAFTGGVTLSAGTLVLNNNNACGNGTLALSVTNGTINSTVSGISIANPVSITNNTNFTGTNNLSLTGNVVLSGTRTLTISANVLTMSGVVSGSAGITKAGAGTLTFSGASVNTYTGATSITAGTLITTKCTSATANKFTQASFTTTALSVTFGTAPVAGETYRLFPGSTTQTFSSITLVGATGRTATYNSTTSTLTIA